MYYKHLKTPAVLLRGQNLRPYRHFFAVSSKALMATSNLEPGSKVYLVDYLYQIQKAEARYYSNIRDDYGISKNVLKISNNGSDSNYHWIRCEWWLMKGVDKLVRFCNQAEQAMTHLEALATVVDLIRQQTRSVSSIINIEPSAALVLNTSVQPSDENRERLEEVMLEEFLSGKKPDSLD
ncbi:hypothetical protein OSTOST_26205 [Ostertagia ostertagi]